jgi:hypothetical protein
VCFSAVWIDNPYHVDCISHCKKIKNKKIKKQLNKYKITIKNKKKIPQNKATDIKFSRTTEQ